ncbi:MAG: fasciclin domain-containing protein [Bacteroidota bacterium]
MNLLKIRKFPLLLLLPAFLMFFASCESDDVDDMVVADKDRTITEYLGSDSDFSTLSAALERTGLDATLDQENADFTLFAPNNAAFEKMGVDLTSVSNEDLTDILLYHVIQDRRLGVVNLTIENRYFETASSAGPNSNNLSIMLERNNDELMVNGFVSVSSTPNDFKNGVIYEMNDVLSLPTIADIAVNDKNLGRLESALTTASGDLVGLLSGADVYTVFAPIDDGFEDIEDVVDALDADQLANVLSYHVVSGNVLSNDLEDDQTVMTLNGEEITIDIDLGIIRIEDQDNEKALVRISDIQTTNGVVHIISKVLLPSDL